MLYKIDLAAYGIVQGSYGKPPYTVAQYTQAKANKDGINAAIQYADANGYLGVILPRGTYSFTYNRLTTDTDYTQYIISPKSNQIIDLNGSVLEIMFDSVNKSPFYTAAGSSYNMPSAVIQLDYVHNVEVRNGEIIGDIYNRSFTNANELKEESTYGIRVYRNCYNFKFTNLDVHGFMGDAFTFSTRSFSTNGTVTPTAGDATPGYMDTSGIITQVAGCYISPIIPIDLAKLKEFTPYAPNTIQIQTSGGYTRVPTFANQFLEIAFLKSDGTFISKKGVRYLEKIVLPYNCTSVQLIFTGEAVGLTSLPNQGYAITQQATNRGEVSFCKIHDNHRGGISNPCDSLTVHNNDIYHNGLDSSIGAPIFNDNTRYAINFEDTYALDVVIRDNNIYNGYNAVLLGVHNFILDNNVITNFTSIGVNIYNNSTGVISRNKFYETIPLGFATSNIKRHITFENNFVFNRKSTFSTSSTATDSVIMKYNNIYTNTMSIVGVDFDFNNNKVYNTPDIVFDQFQGYTIDVNNAKNNYINGSARLNRSSFKANDFSGTILEGFIDTSIGMTTLATSIIELKGITLKGCTMKYNIGGSALTTVPTFLLRLIGCTIIDSTIQLPGAANMTSAITKIGLYVKDCMIKVSTTSPFKVNDNKGFTGIGIVYEETFTRSTVEYTTTDLPLFIGSVYNMGSNAFKHKIKMHSVEVLNNDLFNSKITIGGLF